jgi:signal recognition particle GTPase
VLERSTTLLLASTSGKQQRDSGRSSESNMGDIGASMDMEETDVYDVDSAFNRFSITNNTSSSNKPISVSHHVSEELKMELQQSSLSGQITDEIIDKLLKETNKTLKVQHKTRARGSSTSAYHPHPPPLRAL